MQHASTTTELLGVSPATGDGRPLILIVEDHEDTRFLLCFIMEGCGYRVIQAIDGVQALETAKSVQPDLILMDTSLPNIDGLITTQRIRGLDQLSKVPIIFVSGHAQPEARAAALAMGGDDYFVKPLNLKDLEIAVKNQLASKGMKAKTLDPAVPKQLQTAGH